MTFPSSSLINIDNDLNIFFVCKGTLKSQNVFLYDYISEGLTKPSFSRVERINFISPNEFIKNFEIKLL